MKMAGFGEVAERLRRSTVQVGSRGRGFGSGVILAADGLIVTNAHVVRGSQAQVKLWDGRTFAAEVVSRDTARDLATLQISATGLPAAASGAKPSSAAAVSEVAGHGIDVAAVRQKIAGMQSAIDQVLTSKDKLF